MAERVNHNVEWVTDDLGNVVGYQVRPGDVRAVGGSGSGALAPYVGFVATRTQFPNFFLSTLTENMTTSVHTLMETVDTITIGLANSYVNGSQNTAPDWTEKGPGGATTFTMAAEYPIGSGSYFRCTFGGSVQGVCADNEIIEGVLDNRVAKIPAGAQFRIRIFRTNPLGLPYISNAPSTITGDGWVGAGAVDRTDNGTVAQATSFTFRPLYIVGLTTKRTALILGDSIELGVTPERADGVGEVGIMARAIARRMAYCKATCGGDRLDKFLASRTLRNRLVAYASDLFLGLGTNDVIVDPQRTVAQVLADIASVAAIAPTKPLWYRLIGPLQTTSTTFWSDTAGQTVSAGNNGTRNAINTIVTQGRATGVTGFIDPRKAWEVTPESGLWKPATGARTVTDYSMNSGSASFNSASAAFTLSDHGKKVRVIGAGAAGGNLTGVMTYVSATQVNLTSDGTTALTASTTVAGGTAYIGAGYSTEDGLHPTQAANAEAMMSGFMAHVLA